MVCRLYGHDTIALGRPMIYFIEERNGPRIDIDWTSIDANVSDWHQSDTFALEPCPIDIDQRLFAIWDGGRTCFTCHDRAFLSNAQSFTSKLHRIKPFTYKQSSWFIFSTATHILITRAQYARLKLNTFWITKFHKNLIKASEYRCPRLYDHLACRST